VSVCRVSLSVRLRTHSRQDVAKATGSRLYR